MAGTKINSTLCYIENGTEFLMLFRNKKKNDPCEGKWVGVGGKFEAGENADQCLLREVWEETGIKLKEYHACGIVHFISDTWPDEDMYLYTARIADEDDHFRNDCSDAFECNEGDLRWIPKEQVLSLNLWDGDRYFLKPLLEGKDDIHMTCRYKGHKCVEVIM